MEKTRAKFVCNQIIDNGSSKEIRLSPVKSGIEENDKFWEASPWGKIEIDITNLPAAEIFKVGKPFYIDFIPAAE